MFTYTEKYTEFEYDIQNNNVLYNIHQNCQNTFESLDLFEFVQNILKISIFYFIIYIYIYIYIYNLQNPYFAFLYFFVLLYISQFFYVLVYNFLFSCSYILYILYNLYILYIVVVRLVVRSALTRKLSRSRVLNKKLCHCKID